MHLLSHASHATIFRNTVPLSFHIPAYCWVTLTEFRDAVTYDGVAFRSCSQTPGLRIGLLIAPSLRAHAINTMVTADALLFSSLLSFSIQLMNRIANVWAQRKVTCFILFLHLVFFVNFFFCSNG